MVTVATGGAAAIPGLIVSHGAAAATAAATLAAEGGLGIAVALETAGAVAAAETAFAGAVVAESVVTAITGLTAFNAWNPVGWTLGAVLVGADPHSSSAVTWACYKPIIGEADTDDDDGTPAKPITFAELAAHPEVRRVSVSTRSTAPCTGNLPDVEVENKLGQRFLLRAAYHAERIL
ncbi:hypothetical protein NEMBOFW57_002069 [Staphylotrichum longicolle]|uniref:Uncharacterized protein n=1 Tax=Staphylotrichum longicolle TaxID=669026 RepID=A0AAD4I4C2_9PEZI|nr:hypothetical protein NEMBOFW57_002069 [Staphylotrichum longicolle]